MHCVDCVRAAAAATPEPRTAFGGVVTQPGVVTTTIIAVCVVVYLAQLALPSVTEDFAYSPYLGWSEPWRALTSAFLHSPQTFFHILFNMICLWQLGPYLESLLGRLRFILLYLTCAIAGSAGVLLLAAAPPAGTSPAVAVSAYGSWFTGVLGASGAVFGLFAALLVLNRHLGRSVAGVGVVILINAAFGFIYSGIAWQAHLGGFVAGLAGAGVVAATNTPGRRRYAVWGLVGILAVVLALMAAKYATVAPPFK